MFKKENTDIWDSLNSMDRGELMTRFVQELPYISGAMGITPSDVAVRTGMDTVRSRMIINGKRKMKWSEYMTILFVLWDDEKGRQIIEERGYFPQELKDAMEAGQNTLAIVEEKK